MKRVTILLLALALYVPAFAQTSNSSAANETAMSSKTQEQCACFAPKIPRERSPLGENPYWVFIGFLYACVAADIAGRFAKISYKWGRYEQSRQRHWWVPVYSHLVLASFVVGTSWMAWSQAFAVRHVTSPKEVISAQALLVIVDFIILVMYFSLVLVVGNERESERPIDRSSPSRKHPSYWIAWILSTYVIWDVFAYLLVPLSSGCPCCFWTHSWMSVLCAGLAWVAFFFCLKHIRSDRPLWMLAGDASLLELILFYRALKQLIYSDSVSSVSDQLAQLLHLNRAWVADITFLFFVVLAVLAGACGRRAPRPVVKT